MIAWQQYYDWITKIISSLDLYTLTATPAGDCDKVSHEARAVALDQRIISNI